MDKSLEERIKDIVHSNSWIEFECKEEDGSLLFSTREHGDIDAEEHGQDDYQNAVIVADILANEIDDIKTRIETVDEWVQLNVWI